MTSCSLVHDLDREGTGPQVRLRAQPVPCTNETFLSCDAVVGTAHHGFVSTTCMKG